MAEETSFHTTGNASAHDVDTRAAALELFRSNPLPDDELLWNLGLWTNRQAMARTLWMTDLYRRALDVHGVVMEFGVRWGRNLALFQSLRGIYEPYNYTRKIVGFDTFSGFPSVSEQDGDDAVIEPGAYARQHGLRGVPRAPARGARAGEPDRPHPQVRAGQGRRDRDAARVPRCAS